MTTLLIVDDHLGFRRMARMLLEHSGFDVVGEGGSVADAIAAVRSVRPDVVLLDVQLPDGDGIEATPALLAESPPPHVVLISSRTASDYAERVARSPALGFISKEDLTGASLHALLESA